jgi:hypothetical protein
LDVQLPVQSVPITTKIVSLNLAQGEVYWIQHYVVSSTNKTERQEIFLKVVLNTIAITPKLVSLIPMYGDVYLI